MATKLTVELFDRTKITEHADTREARRHVVDICVAQGYAKTGTGTTGTFLTPGRGIRLGTYQIEEV